MAIELHYFPGNASMAPHIVLHELGLPFSLRLVDRSVGAHKRPDYLALNPNGLIPVLRDGQLVLYEAAAICLHLADKTVDAATLRLLPPQGSDSRAQAFKWLIWLTNTLQATLIHYFYPERMVDDGNVAGAAQVKAHAQVRIGGLLDQIEAQLASHQGPWLLGVDYSVADPYALMLCRWTRGFDGPESPPAHARPAIHAYLQRMLARPAVQRAFAAEGLTVPWL